MKLAENQRKQVLNYCSRSKEGRQSFSLAQIKFTSQQIKKNAVKNIQSLQNQPLLWEIQHSRFVPSLKSHPEMLWLHLSTWCQYLPLTGSGLGWRVMIRFHTIEQDIRLTVSWLIWFCVWVNECVRWGSVWVRGSWPTYLHTTNLLMPDSHHSIIAHADHTSSFSKKYIAF